VNDIGAWGTTMAWPEISQSISHFLPPYFFGTLAAAAFGAFAGAWVNSPIQTKKSVVAEVNGVSAAMVLCLSICNISIALKRQFVGPMRVSYTRAKQEHAKAKFGALGSGQIVFTLQADLETFSQRQQNYWSVAFLTKLGFAGARWPPQFSLCRQSTV
jgi:hypothetical protein